MFRVSKYVCMRVCVWKRIRTTAVKNREESKVIIMKNDARNGNQFNERK